MEDDPRLKWAFLALGAASYLSWNAMITATPYFLARLTGSPALQETFSSYMSLTFNMLNLFALIHATATAKQNVALSRIRPSLVILIGCLSLLFISPFISTSPSTFFVFAIVNSAIQAYVGGHLITSIVTLAALFNPESVQAVSEGQSIVGVLISIVELISATISLRMKRGTPPTSETEQDLQHANMTAFMFFGVSTGLLFVSMRIHTWLMRQPASAFLGAPAPIASAGHSRLSSRIEHEADEESEGSPLLSALPDDRSSILHVGVSFPITSEDLEVKNVIKMNSAFNLAVLIVYIITMAIYPPITNLIQSVNKPTSPNTISIFTPVLFNALHFLVYNTGDYLGTSLLSRPLFRVWSGQKLFVMAAFRVLFIPIFLACNVNLSPLAISRFAPSNAIINSDVLYLFILLVFSVTNGHIATMCMMAASSPEHNRRLRAEQVEVSATVIQFFMAIGYALGSIASFGVRGILCNCNPFIA